MAKEDQKPSADETQPAPDAVLSEEAQAAGEPLEGGTQEGSEIELTVEERVIQLEEALVEASEQSLRAQADAQNVIRRAQQDVEKARKFALERFVSELLPVLDNLERALESTEGGDAAVEAIAQGVDLTLKSFNDVLAKFNVEVVSPLGEPFDPNLHQAMSMVENKDVEPNTVIAVMQKGYTLSGRLVRPAMVMVSKSG